MTIYGRSVELVSRCVECDLAEPESLVSLGGSAPGVVDGISSAYLPTFLPAHTQTHTHSYKENKSCNADSQYELELAICMIFKARRITHILVVYLGRGPCVVFVQDDFAGQNEGRSI